MYLGTYLSSIYPVGQLNKNQVHKYELLVFNYIELELLVFTDIENEHLVFNDIEGAARIWYSKIQAGHI